MTKLFLTLVTSLLIFSCLPIIGQEKRDTVWITAQYPPELIGTQMAFMQYVYNAAAEAPELKGMNPKGRVTVEYIIETDGSIKWVQEDKKHNQLHDPLLVKVACRIISEMPFKYKPARNGATPVRYVYYAPVIFGRKYN